MTGPGEASTPLFTSVALLPLSALALRTASRVAAVAGRMLAAGAAFDPVTDGFDDVGGGAFVSAVPLLRGAAGPLVGGGRGAEPPLTTALLGALLVDRDDETEAAALRREEDTGGGAGLLVLVFGGAVGGGGGGGGAAGRPVEPMLFALSVRGPVGAGTGAAGFGGGGGGAGLAVDGRGGGGAGAVLGTGAGGRGAGTVRGFLPSSSTHEELLRFRIAARLLAIIFKSSLLSEDPPVSLFTSSST